ncbi:hypothetical protein [uncultured Desulfuromonas sp.]|uniref:hypothetical protein n=1 Tax=uncultured Desulfuromonas sp. TaxID=181013 RepID=UPI002AAB3883|nr:hypothetical protein [uncultured Desulfuromonas sp.]
MAYRLGDDRSIEQPKEMKAISVFPAGCCEKSPVELMEGLTKSRTDFKPLALSARWKLYFRRASLKSSQIELFQHPIGDKWATANHLHK